MKKIILIIILSLTAFVAILFLIAFIDHIVNDPKKGIRATMHGGIRTKKFAL